MLIKSLNFFPISLLKKQREKKLIHKYNIKCLSAFFFVKLLAHLHCHLIPIMSIICCSGTKGINKCTDNISSCRNVRYSGVLYYLVEKFPLFDFTIYYSRKNIEFR